MKIKIAFAIIVLAALIGCNENKTRNADHSHEQDSVTHASSEMQEEKLVLNDGKKWKLDEATRNNIDSIRKTVQTVATSQQKDYAKAAADFETDANRLVSQCRMSGKDHEMLHVWLENFLSGLKQLKSTSTEEQPMAFERMETLVKEFDACFE